MCAEEDMTGRTALEYRCCGDCDDDRAVICFDGHFGGKPVHWRAEVQTLARAYREAVAEGRLPPGTVLTLQQFIDIPEAPVDGGPIPIRIALDLPQIDHAALLKTVVMVRQYKRLRRGRHDFGPARRFPQPAEPGDIEAS